MMESKSSSLRVALAATFLVAVILILAFRTASVLNRPAPAGQIDLTHWGMQDFRDAIYYPCRSFAEGRNPYDATEHFSRYPVGQLFPLYSPLTLIIHQPLSWLPFAISQSVYFGLTILLTIGLAALMLRVIDVPVQLDFVFVVAGLLLISRPGHMNLVLGQSSVQVVLFSLLALYLSRKRIFLSGFFLALATFKPTFGAPLFLLMLARRDDRAAFTGLAIGCVMTLPVFAYLSYLEGGVGPFAEVLTANSDTFDAHEGRDPATSFSRIDAYVLFCKLSGSPTHNRFELIFAVGLTSLAGGLIFFKSRIGKGLESDQAFAQLSLSLILLTILVAIYHHAYDWILVAPAFGILVFSKPLADSINRRVRIACAACLCLPAVNYFSTNTFKGLIENESILWTGITSVNAVALLVAWFLMASMLIRLPTEK